MSKPTIGQSHSVIQILANNADWENLNHLILQKIVDDPREAGRQFTAFLKNGGRVVVDSPRVISIDRSMPFNPVSFISKEWSIEEQDEKSIELTEINLTEVRFESTLEKGEKSIKGEDKLNRLKEITNSIRLDAGIFKTLWENQILIPEKWKEKTNGNTTSIHFDGTVVKNSAGDRCVIYMQWDGVVWDWDCRYLGNDYYSNRLSAVL